jgi:ABC-type branched-subunit amino acid transport system ATPase component/ABC-type branched-subunit amino acid transport system permease subunit
MRAGLRRALAHPLTTIGLAFVLLPLVLPAIGSTVGLATEIVIYALYGIGYNLLLGYAGLVSFGPSAYFGVAAYAAGLCHLHLFRSVYPSVLVGTAAAALTGLVIGLLILRRRGLYFSLLTLAFTQLLFEIAFHWTDVTGGENGLQGIARVEFQSPRAFYAFSAVVVGGAVYCLWRIAHSPFGRVLQAIRDNEERARCLGYNTRRYRLLAFVLSAAFMGLAGSLLTFLIEGVYADNLNWQHAGDPVMMTILGGMHHFLGPLWGAGIYILLSDQLSSYTEHWWLVFGALLIAFVLLSPEGLSGIWARLRRRPPWHLTRGAIPPRPATGATSAIPTDGRPTAARPSPAGPLLAVRGLRKRFGNLIVADGVDLDLRPGELHSLIGPNGAGKTTFFNMLTGLVPADGGQILFKGRDIARLAVHERIGGGLARSFQIVSVFRNLSVFENVRVAVQAHSPHRLSLWRDATALDGVVARTWGLLAVVGLETRAAEDAMDLSHGEQRLLELAITLATEPEVLLLDEPLAGLADVERERISALVRRLAGRHSILLIEHDIDRVRSFSDRITVLHEGHIIADGAPAEVVSQPQVITAYLGRPADTQPAVPAAARAAAPGSGPILRLAGVNAGYAGSLILHDVSLEVREGEIVALLGRNGVGKTTTLRTIMGALRPTSGAIEFRGTSIARSTPDRVNRLGISIVPEGRRIFPNLTVLDNLLLAQRPNGATLEEVWELFPRLRRLGAARGETLSGGERQMLAIGRALMAPTTLMLLDEPLEGLAPSVVTEVLEAIARLRGRTSILLVEQKVDLTLRLADRAYVMVNGRVAHEGQAEALRRDEKLQVQLLGV